MSFIDITRVVVLNKRRGCTNEVRTNVKKLTGVGYHVDVYGDASFRYPYKTTQLPTGNVAQSKNKILDDTVKLGYRYLVIIDDDILINNTRSIEMYINLIRYCKIAVSTYSYHNNLNKVVTKPTPLCDITVPGATVPAFDLCRNHGGGFSVYDMALCYDTRFNEEYDVYEQTEFNVRTNVMCGVPFPSLSIDLHRSDLYFTQVVVSPIRHRIGTSVTSEKLRFQKESPHQDTVDISTITGFFNKLR